MLFALTGTPGCGKTSIAEILVKEGINVVFLNQFFKENSLLYDFDEESGSYEVDIDQAAELMVGLMEEGGNILVEGHLSHLLPCDEIIVLRCNPSVLKPRLESRGYKPEKVLENMEAEALDVILVESIELSRPTFEVDCTNLSMHEAADAVKSIMNGEGHKYLPGNIDWSEELLKWC